MDDYLKQNLPAEPETASETEPEKVDTSVNLPAEAEKPKRHSLKSAQTLLKRLQTELEKKTEQVAALKKEIAALKPEIRSIAALVKQLEREEIEKKMQDAFRMKSKHMTGNQVMAALDLVQQLDGDLCEMDIDEIADLIRSQVSDKKKEQSAEQPKADTSVNFSAQTGTQEA